VEPSPQPDEADDAQLNNLLVGESK
jgi:hypothetical protein